MNSKTRRLWAALILVCVGAIVGCGKPSKSGGVKTPDQPLPNTTDSK